MELAREPIAEWKWQKRRTDPPAAAAASLASKFRRGIPGKHSQRLVDVAGAASNLGLPRQDVLDFGHPAAA